MEKTFVSGIEGRTNSPAFPPKKAKCQLKNESDSSDRDHLIRALLMGVVLFLTSFFSVQAQNDSLQFKRLYETWIFSASQPKAYRGFLFEVSDSSLVVSNALNRREYLAGNDALTSFSYSDLKTVQFRRNNSQMRGAIIGGAAGLAVAIAGVSALNESGDNIPPIYSIPLIYFPFTALGAGAGFLLGSIKVVIPLNQQWDSFEKNRARLQNFALVEQKVPLTSEHQSYIGFSVGPSMPIGDFGSRFISEGSSKTEGGYNFNIPDLGLMIFPHLGLALTLFNNQYYLPGISEETFWGWTGALIGPVISYPVHRKFLIDFVPQIGSSSIQLVNPGDLETEGTGFTYNLGLMLRYNLDQRWNLSSRVGYIGSNQKMTDLSNESFRAFNLGFGLAYRFR
ncbi:MAG: hypothetical protein V2I46_06485 [Bacteroides sp.]|nr:hypothetical protein [Bacteroides sp.]